MYFSLVVSMALPRTTIFAREYVARKIRPGRCNVDNDNNVQSSPSLLSGLIILGEFTLKAVRASGKQ